MKKNPKRRFGISVAALTLIPVLISVGVMVAIVACMPGEIQPRGSWLARTWPVARVASAIAVGFTSGAGVAWMSAAVVGLVEDRARICLGILSYTVEITATVLWTIALVAIVPSAVWWISLRLLCTY